MNKINNIFIFSDESGSIPKLDKKKHDFFIVVLLIIDNDKLKLVQKLFKRWRTKKIKELNKNPKDELKGIHLQDFQREELMNLLIDKCKIYYSWLDSKTVKSKMRINTKLTHNFMIGETLQKFLKSNHIEKNDNEYNIILEIDEMNNGSGQLKSLEDYLNYMIIFKMNFFNTKVKTNYIDSCKQWNIQIVDIIANYIYRKISSNKKNELKKWKNIFERQIY